MESTSVPPPEWDGVDVAPLRDLSRRSLFQALDNIQDDADSRSLFLDPSLAGALGLVVDVASLKQHGVERMFWLESPEKGRSKDKEHFPINAPTRGVVYVCRPETKWMHVIAGEHRFRRGCYRTILALPRLPMGG